MTEPYIVFVLTDESGYITAVNSSAFLPNPGDWSEIDRGFGDRYHHAQGNYFPKPIITDDGAFCYRLVDHNPVECSAEDIAGQEASNRGTAYAQTWQKRIEELEVQNELLMECVLELSEVGYA